MWVPLMWLRLRDHTEAKAGSVVPNLPSCHPAYPDSLPGLSGNAAQLLSLELPQLQGGEDPMARRRALAKAIRAGIKEIRDDPQLTLDWLRTAAARLEEAAGKGQAGLSMPERGEVTVNSNLR